MGRPSFTREFKLETVRLIKDRGVTIARAARDLAIHENVLRKWMRELAAGYVAFLDRVEARE